MGYTQDQLDALEKAIAQGATKVKHGDMEVTYRSLDEMKRIADMMRKELGLNPKGPYREQPLFNKGL